MWSRSSSPNLLLCTEMPSFLGCYNSSHGYVGADPLRPVWMILSDRGRVEELCPVHSIGAPERNSTPRCKLVSRLLFSFASSFENFGVTIKGQVREGPQSSRIHCILHPAVKSCPDTRQAAPWRAGKGKKLPEGADTRIESKLARFESSREKAGKRRKQRLTLCGG